MVAGSNPVLASKLTSPTDRIGVIGTDENEVWENSCWGLPPRRGSAEVAYLMI